MIDSRLQEKINSLLRALEAQEPVEYELGTPQLVETTEVFELVDLGSCIVPYLLELIKSEKPKVTAYIVLVLDKLGDARTIKPLRELREKYQKQKHKTEWDYAVIGQCNAAIFALDHVKK
jgi:HEAT repeat protein